MELELLLGLAAAAALFPLVFPKSYKKRLPELKSVPPDSVELLPAEPKLRKFRHHHGARTGHLPAQGSLDAATRRHQLQGSIVLVKPPKDAS